MKRVAVGLVLVVAVCGIALPRYWSAKLLPDLLADAAVPGVAAIGVCFVLACGSLDLAVGSLAACASLVVAAAVGAGLPPSVALALGLVFGAAVGFGMGHLLRVTRVPAFIGTLGGLFALRAAALWYAEESLAIQSPAFTEWSAWTWSVGDGRWRPAALTLVLATAVGAYVMHAWHTARAAWVVGADEQAARQAGLDPDVVRVRMHTVSGLCGGLAGALLALSSSAGTSIGANGLELDALACAVVGGASLLGGRASVVGAVLAALLFAALARGLQFAGIADAGWGRLVAAALLFLYLLLDRLTTRARVGQHSP